MRLSEAEMMEGMQVDAGETEGMPKDPTMSANSAMSASHDENVHERHEQNNVTSRDAWNARGLVHRRA